jgi:hypothetical protein
MASKIICSLAYELGDSIIICKQIMLPEMVKVNLRNDFSSIILMGDSV